MNSNKYLTISALNKYIKSKFEVDEHLTDVYLKGEVSNFKAHSSGHLYFSLKDESSRINAVMFKFKASNLGFMPTDGMKVLVRGKISVYEATGNYQIYVEEMIEDGLGKLFLAFEQLKKKLLEQGLFDDNIKKPIPKIPCKIGVITAPTGAVIRDILTTVERRWPFCDVILFPTLVQGENAAEDIARNIKRAEDSDIDVLIVGRGGGSIEDLWAFNEEVVARAIFDAKIPIISAVGHETDITIADLVADLRAPTPTAAAEMAVPSLFEMKKQLINNQVRLNEYMRKRLSYLDMLICKLRASYVLKKPMVLYETKLEKLGLINEKLNNYMKDKFNVLETNLAQNTEKLIILNPMETVKRGYAIVKLDDNVVSSIQNISKQDNINVELKDGIILGKVTDIKGGNLND